MQVQATGKVEVVGKNNLIGIIDTQQGDHLELAGLGPYQILTKMQRVAERLSLRFSGPILVPAEAFTVNLTDDKDIPSPKVLARFSAAYSFQPKEHVTSMYERGVA
ncbi:MAG: hypothetical protein EOM20_09050 [Spartobacteria bacterium]|nr:hypothetical protein [Spartobacteria bacterium]